MTRARNLLRPMICWAAGLAIGLALGAGWNWLEARAAAPWATPTGLSYHRPDCGHLRGEGRRITLEELWARGLTPCRQCEPRAFYKVHPVRTPSR